MMECWSNGVMENCLQFASLQNLGAQRAHLILAQGNALGMQWQRVAG